MKKLFYLICLGATTTSLHAQDFDHAFGGDGWVTENITTEYQGLTDVYLQADKKIIVAGYSAVNAFDGQSFLIRYNTDGSRDNSFGNNGLVYPPYDNINGADEQVAVAQNANGKIFVASSSAATSGGIKITRLNANGSVDNTFANNGSVDDSTGNNVYFEHVYAIAIQPDGKILTAGLYSHTNPSSTGAWVMRHNADGTRDNGFGTNGLTKIVGENYAAFRLLIQPDGKIIGGGKKRVTQQQKDDFLIFRLNADGTLDNTFGALQDGTVIIGLQDMESVRGMGLQSDGSLIFGGPCGNGYTHLRIVKLQANGLPDITFGQEHTSTGNIGFTKIDLEQFQNQSISDLTILPDDKIMIAGSWSNKFIAIRYTANGIPDSTFSSNARADSSFFTQSVSCTRAALDNTNGRMYAVGAVGGGGTSNCYLTAVKIGAGPSSINENSFTNDANVYPNPANTVVFLPTTISQAIQLDILSSTGQLIRSEKNITNNRLDISSLANGIYFIKILTNEKQYISRLIISH